MSTPENRGSLSEKFADFGAAPSEGMWEGIVGQLEEKSSRKFAFWWWFTGFAAVGLISSWFIFKHVQTSEQENAVTLHLPTLSNQILESKTGIDSYTSLENRLSNHSNKQDITIFKVKEHDHQSGDQQKESKNNHTEIPPSDELTIHENQPQIKVQEKTSIINLLAVRGAKRLDQSCVFPIFLEKNKTKQNRPVEIGFRIAYYHDLASPTSSSENTLSTFSADSDAPEITGSNALSDPNNTASPAFSTVNRNLNLDFTIGKYLSPRWMLNSGIWFSRTNYKSDYYSFTLSSSSTNISSIGLPLGASYDFIKRKRFDWRGQLNFLNEFAVFEHATIDYINEGQTVTSKFTKGYSAALDFSLNHLIKIGSNLHLNIAPSYRRYLTQKVQADAFLLKKNQWVGGSIGVLWRL